MPIVVSFLLYLRKKGYREATLDGYSDVFKHLARLVGIDFDYVTETEGTKLLRKRK